MNDVLVRICGLVTLVISEHRSLTLVLYFYQSDLLYWELSHCSDWSGMLFCSSAAKKPELHSEHMSILVSMV